MTPRPPPTISYEYLLKRIRAGHDTIDHDDVAEACALTAAPPAHAPIASVAPIACPVKVRP
jgi:hypothetical protein